MWSESPIIGFDTETTGVRPEESRLVTCSLVTATAEGVTRRYWLANPGVEIPESATQVHGITTEQARAEGRPIEEVLTEIADTLAAHMEQEWPIVAFNAIYDLTLLEAELSRHDIPTLAERLGGIIYPVVDPYLLDRSVDRYRKGKRRLEDLCRHYHVWNDDDFHNAEADVMATLRLLGAMLRTYPELAEQPLIDIQEQEEQAYAEFITFLNKRAQQEGRPPAAESIEWPVAQAV